MQYIIHELKPNITEKVQITCNKNNVINEIATTGVATLELLKFSNEKLNNKISIKVDIDLNKFNKKLGVEQLHDLIDAYEITNLLAELIVYEHDISKDF